MNPKVLVRGGGDLASGVILRLAHCGCRLLVTERLQPLVVRRTVSFAEAIMSGTIQVEDIQGEKITNINAIEGRWNQNVVPILADPEDHIIGAFKPDIIVDARMLKKPLQVDFSWASLIIGLGPGFTAQINCHGLVETQRGPFLGRVYWQGSAQKNTGIPESVMGHDQDRVLRAPLDGVFRSVHHIGDVVAEGEVIGDVAGFPIRAPFKGMIRGLIHYGFEVTSKMKIGDIDPRCDERLIHFVSDKALAVGGGVLEAIYSKLNH